MKVIAKLKNTKNGDLQLQVDNFQSRTELEELELDQYYTVDIIKFKDARTKKQNKLMWELIHKIAEKYGEKNEWNIYINALERANVKYEYIMILPKAERLLKENFRAVKFIKKRIENGVEFHVYKCFYGSSKFNKEEMANLINSILEMAVNVGINTAFYEEVLI